MTVVHDAKGFVSRTLSSAIYLGRFFLATSVDGSNVILLIDGGRELIFVILLKDVR